MAHRTYKEKMDQATREAKATVVALVITVIAWIVLGFGLSGLDIKLLSTPLWVWGGTVGIYIVSIVVVLVLRAFVFEDFDLDDHDDVSAGLHKATSHTHRTGVSASSHTPRHAAHAASTTGDQIHSEAADE